MLFKASPSPDPLRHEGVSEAHGMAASGGWLVSPPSDTAENPQRISVVLPHKRSSEQGVPLVLGPCFCKPETP